MQTPTTQQVTRRATRQGQVPLRRAPPLDRTYSKNSPPCPGLRCLGLQEAPEAVTDSRRQMNTA